MDFLGVKIADGRLGQSLKAVTGKPGVDDVKMEVTALEAMMRRVYQDEYKRGRKSKLTWNTRPDAELMDETKLVGNWRLDWPYVRLGNYAVIQNRQLMNIGGQPITLEDLSDVRHKWQTKTGEVKDAPSDRETATAAWKKHMSDAIATDPMVCELCGTYRAKGGDDRMRHLYNAHPVEFAQRVGLEEQETSGEVMVSAIPDDEVSPANEDGTFSCCGRTYSSLGRLNQHRTVSKAHRTE